jgi:HopA1 effector protein family
MSVVHPDFLTVFAAVKVLSPTSYRFRDVPREFPTPAPPSPEPTPPALDPVFLPALELDLYARLYTQPTPIGAPADFLAQRDHISALSAANNGQGSWEPGWQVVGQEPDGRFSVRKDDITFWVGPDGLRVRSGEPAAGDYCRVRVAKEMRSLIPGFYCAVGDGDENDARDAPAPLVRFYWHLTAQAAVPHMAAITGQLNSRGIPFRMKVLSDPNAYGRADAGVLYLERPYLPRLGNTLAAVHQEIAADLRPEVPLFSRPLAPGLGVAEDPGTSLSFGQHRCQLAARAVWASFLRGDTTPEQQAATCAEVLRAANLDPAHPHLEPGSVDRYSLEPRPDRSRPAGIAGKKRARSKRKERRS